jgi:SMC interacting uncharacterized protein involved in chromosome segregation
MYCFPCVPASTPTNIGTRDFASTYQCGSTRSNSEREEYVKEQNDTDRDLKKIDKKKKKLESFLQSYTTETKAKLKVLETDIESLQGTLNDDQRVVPAEAVTRKIQSC